MADQTANNIWPTDEQIERAAEMLVSRCCQREIGHFPVTDEDRDDAAAILRYVNEESHGVTWNATPYAILAREGTSRP